VLPALSPAGGAAVARDQATQLRDALLLASCQPTVGAFFNFELIDEDRLAGWQSGLLWRDGAHKPSYEAFKDELRRIRSGVVSCSTVTGSRSWNVAYRSSQPCRAGAAMPVSDFWPSPPAKVGANRRLARSPALARVGQRREDGLELLAQVLEGRRQR
jgi:hypothetical protein